MREVSRLSGLYRSDRGEELRLDVDGPLPQMAASGTLQLPGFSRPIPWVARLAAEQELAFAGEILYGSRAGKAAGGPLLRVRILVARGETPGNTAAEVTFYGEAGVIAARSFEFALPRFHPVEFEFDAAEGASPVAAIDTSAHPNHPAGLPRETLSIEDVYRRAGFGVTRSGGDSIVPLVGAGRDLRWNDRELHDAIQAYWSHFSHRPQWALWAFFASLHETGPSLGGVMFDDVGREQRQGAAIFTDSFISQAPAGDWAPEAWVRRMRFWTACHEMGHCFNLAHSWQKSLGKPWVPLTSDPEARSFMNYPYNVRGGERRFFATFDWRFGDAELLFLRHAPESFVEMGNAAWFDHHGFRRGGARRDVTLRLEARLNRPRPVFEFLEPVVLELKATNISSRRLRLPLPLSNWDCLGVLIEKKGSPAQPFRSYARHCFGRATQTLDPGQSIYESVFVSAGCGGFQLAEPGSYTVRVALRGKAHLAIARPLQLRIAPPKSAEEQGLARDFFSDEVGRVLAFDGSRYLARGNDALREVAERLPHRRVALHARVALGSSLASEHKQILFPQKRIEVRPPDWEEASRQFAAALAGDMNVAAETLGHIDYKWYVDRYTDLLAERGELRLASDLQRRLYQTLAARGVMRRVLAEVARRRDEYERA